MDKVKVKFILEDFEEIKIYELQKDWTYRDIEDLFDIWLDENSDNSWDILEVNGEPFKE